MSDKLVEALFYPPSSSSSESRSRSRSMAGSRSKSRAFSRSRLRSLACSRSEGRQSNSDTKHYYCSRAEAAVDIWQSSRSDRRESAVGYAGTFPEATVDSRQSSSDLGRSCFSMTFADRCEAATRIAATAVAEAGSPSEEEPPRATGDELLDLLQDFDSDDTEIERCLEQKKQSEAAAASDAAAAASDRKAAAASEGAAARAAEQQLDLMQISWNRGIATTQGLPIEWPDFASAAFVVGDSFEHLEDRIACQAHDQYLYIGGTACVERRWLGDRGMPPHADKFERMIIIAIADGRLGGMIEAHLIKYSKDSRGIHCLNTALDSRGLTSGINFIYMCLQ